MNLTSSDIGLENLENFHILIYIFFLKSGSDSESELTILEKVLNDQTKNDESTPIGKMKIVSISIRLIESNTAWIILKRVELIIWIWKLTFD